MVQDVRRSRTVENRRSCASTSFADGYMGDGGPLQIACFLEGTDTTSGAIYATMVPDSKKMDMPYVVAGTAKRVRDSGYERVCLHGVKEAVLQLLLDKVAKECRPQGQDWQIHVSPTQSHQGNGAVEKSRLHLLERILRFSKTIPSSEVTTHSPMLPWTIRHAVWLLPRYNERKDTRMTPYEKSRGQKYRKEILPLGEQVVVRRPRAKVNQLLQSWVTGLWLGRDTLSDEHVRGTAAGVMRSLAVRRLQEPARWVPAALRSNALHPVVTTSESSGPPSLAETCIRRAC